MVRTKTVERMIELVEDAFEGFRQRIGLVERRQDAQGDRWLGLEERMYEAEQRLDALERKRALMIVNHAYRPVIDAALHPPIEGALRAAVERTQAVRFRYTKPGETWESRVLSPYEVVSDRKGVEYGVRGWDHDRQDIRTFRFDRTEAVTQAEVEFRPPDLS